MSDFIDFILATNDINHNITLKSIFSSDYFSDEGFDRPRWNKEGSTYTTLRKYKRPNVDVSTLNTNDLTSTTASDSALINQNINEVILHDAVNNSSSILVGYNQLIPSSTSQPITIDDYESSHDNSKMLIFTNSKKVWRHKTKGQYWVLDLNPLNPELKQLGGLFKDSTDLMFATFSPIDSSRIAFVYKNNIYLEDINSNTITQLTFDGSDLIINGTFDWVYEEEFQIRHGFRWSPDGESIAYWQIDQSNVPIVYLINNTDGTYPKLLPIPYPKTGQTNPSARIGIVSVNALDISTVWMNVPGDSRNNYIADVEFHSNGSLIIQQLNRLQNTLIIYVGDIHSATVDVMFVDSDDAWVDIMHKLIWINNDESFLLLSEIYQWRQLFVVSPFTNSSNNAVAVTPVGMDVDHISGYDSSLSHIYFIASPHDPLTRYLYKVNCDGSDLQQITPIGDSYVGTNSYTLSSDGKYAVYSYSSFNCPPITKIVSLPDHTEMITLSLNDQLNRRINAIYIPPIEYFSILIHNNTVELDAWCLYPPNFDSNKKYPVFFYVYGEPAAQIVRKQYAGKIGIWHRMLAQNGAVVISIDNRGENIRSLV